ncbi:hypothetical protein [Nostoc sp.]|uniref:hypothetical protein n=1 Tax=Nostoc sp. TaxID=1180 RepID=UPI002FF66B2E
MLLPEEYNLRRKAETRNSRNGYASQTGCTVAFKDNYIIITTSDRYIDNVVSKPNKQVAKIYPKTKFFTYRDFSGNSIGDHIVQLGSTLATSSYP